MIDRRDADCLHWRELLAVLPPDEPSPSDQRALEVHLRSCPTCTSVRDHYSTLSAWLRICHQMRRLQTFLLASFSYGKNRLCSNPTDLQDKAPVPRAAMNLRKFAFTFYRLWRFFVLHICLLATMRCGVENRVMMIVIHTKSRR